MKISELIQQLKIEQETHGDKEVYVRDCDGYAPAKVIEFCDGYDHFYIDTD